MDEHDVLAERFEAHRARLRAVAYHTLGSADEADDAVQEAWLRLSRTDPGTIGNLGGWLTTTVARVSLNMLASRREQPVGVHLPESTLSAADGTDPETQALLADSIGPALLVILHTLAPAERLAFVLHDTFAVPFDDIAAIVGRSPAAARQLASRARRRVQGVALVPGTHLTPGVSPGQRPHVRVGEGTHPPGCLRSRPLLCRHRRQRPAGGRDGAAGRNQVTSKLVDTGNQDRQGDISSTNI
jgi:RNA polymerase sigma-70 factor (ECF subfamily)